MTLDSTSRLPEMLKSRETELLTGWLAEQTDGNGGRSALIPETERREQSREFLNLLREGAQRSASIADLTDINAAQWNRLRDMLAGISRTRAQQGFTPTEIATFVFSLKKPLFEALRQEFGQDGETFYRELWTTTLLLDNLGLYTTELYQAAREEVIVRQQQDMMELSIPVVKLWEGILALPIIGTLDSTRTQVVMETLLQRIVETGADIAIIDITGVPTVDTLVAQHLLKTVAAARLMGADCIISGIRPQIAQTIVHLGVDLSEVLTKATLADAFAIALQRKGLGVTKK